MIDVEVSEETTDRLHAILAGIENAEEKVLKPALARGLSAGKTAFSKQTRETYHVSPSILSSYSKVGYKNVSVSGNGIIGSIEYSGGVIPLFKFNVAPKKPTYGKKAVKASVMRSGSQVVFDNAFIAQMKSGHLGIFEGKGTWRRSTRPTKAGGNTENNEKIKELFGPSVPRMAENAVVLQSVEDRVNEVINQRIDHEIERLLSGNGG